LEANFLVAKGRPGQAGDSLATYLRTDFQGDLSRYSTRLSGLCCDTDFAQTGLTSGYLSHRTFDGILPKPSDNSGSNRCYEWEKSSDQGEAK